MSEQHIFVEAMNRQDGPERRQFLDQACGDDEALRARAWRSSSGIPTVWGVFWSTRPSL